MLHRRGRSLHSLGRLVVCNLGKVTTCLRRTVELKRGSRDVRHFVRGAVTRVAAGSLSTSRLATLTLGANRVNIQAVTLLSGTGASECNGPRVARMGVKANAHPNVLVDKRSLRSLRRLLRRAGSDNISMCARNRVLPTRCCPTFGGCARFTKGCKGT